MNTIKIFLKEDGGIATLEKNFELYQGSYQNKLINVYVPVSILPPNYTLDNSNIPIKELGTAVFMQARSLSRGGEYVNSAKFYMRFVKKAIINRPEVGREIEYALYERRLPIDFCFNAGNVDIETSVVNVDNTQTEAQQPEIISIITTQRCVLAVQPASHEYDKDSNLEPSDVDRLEADINTLLARTDILDEEVNKKQDKRDETIDIELAPTEKTVVGAINAIGAQAKTNQKDIDKNAQDIADLKDTSISGVNWVGAIEENFVPEYPYSPEFIARLDEFVKSKEGRTPKEGDYIEWKALMDDKLSIYNIPYKTIGGWQKPDLQAPVEKASNFRYGVIKGNYAEPQTEQNKIRTNIIDGKITDIRVGEQSIGQSIPDLQQTQADILNGVASVGLARKAIGDENRLNISQNYALAKNYYDKETSDSKYLPRTYNNIYYYSNQGLVDNVPSDEQSLKYPQFEEEFQGIREYKLFTNDLVLQGKYNFTKNSVDNTRLMLGNGITETYDFRLVTSIIKKDKTSVPLAVDTLFGKKLVATEEGNIEAVDITSIYNELTTNEIETEDGDILRKEFYFRPSTSTANTIGLFSNTVFPSTFNLVAQGVSFNINTINGMAEIPIDSLDWEQQTDGTYKAYIPQTKHRQPPTNKYGLELQRRASATSVERIAFTPTIDDNGNITIFSDYPLDCALLIYSAVNKVTYQTLQLENPPDKLEPFSLDIYRSVNILRTTPMVGYIELPTPSDTGRFYRVFVSNDKNSTEYIELERGSRLGPGLAIEFLWAGSTWVKNFSIKTTGQLYDTANDRPLNDTLRTYEKRLTTFNLGSRPLNQEFDILSAELLFEDYPLIVSVEVSNYIVDLHRSDMGLNKDKAYYGEVMIVNGKEFALTLVVTKSTGKGILYQEEQPDNKTLSSKVDQNTNDIAELKTQHLLFNQLFDTANSILITANGLVVTNIYGGHHIEGTTTGQYYHKMYNIDTTSGHKYYFAPNFSDTANVYAVGHIDSSSFNTKYSKVFTGGNKFDMTIQIEKNKTINLDVQPILVDLTEMFGQGNEPTTEVEAQQYLAKNTYYPYVDNTTKTEVNSASNTPSDTINALEINPSVDMTYTATSNGYLILAFSPKEVCNLIVEFNGMTISTHYFSVMENVVRLPISNGQTYTWRFDKVVEFNGTPSAKFQLAKEIK